MPRGVLLAGLFILVVQQAHPQSVGVRLYNEGNALYRAGKFDAALEKYILAATGGVNDWRLFYNLGNVHFKVGRTGEAIVWYERALRLNPRDEDVVANLRFLNRIKKDQEPLPNQNPVWNFLTGTFLYPTLNGLTLALCVALVGLVALGLWHVWRPETANLHRGISLGVLGAVVLVCAFWLGTRVHYKEGLREAVIVTSRAVAHSGPDERQTAVLVIHEGTKVRIDRTEGTWALVRLASGLGGWMQQNLFVEI